MPPIHPAPDPAAAVWRPVLLRALVAAAFGGLSIFWQRPGTATVAYLTAAYLVFTAKAVWDLSRGPATGERVRPLLAGACAAWLLASVALVVVPTTAGLVVAAGGGLLVAGVLELAAWWRHRRGAGPARDALVTGLAGAGSGAGLLWLGPGLDAHGLWGIAGGGAVIVGVFLMIAAFGYRHDARAAARR